MKDELFDQFESMSPEEWLARIEKELRGKPLDVVFWELSEDWQMPPFGHPEDPISVVRAGKKTQAGWLVGEAVGNAKELRQALEGGAQALSLSAGQLAVLREPLKQHQDSGNYLIVEEAAGKELEEVARDLQGLGLSAAISLQGLPEPGKLSALPGLRCLVVDGRAEYREDPGQTPTELAALLREGDKLMAYYTEAGLDPGEVNEQLYFRLTCGNSFYVEIAKLRALRLLWANVLEAYGLPEPARIPPIEVSIAPEALVEDTYLNMIRLTTQAMSAVIGGCDLLFLPPADLLADEKHPSFTRRIARNVQHLLKAESHFDAVQDPAGGSYYFEKLTETLAERAWKHFTAPAA